MCPEANAVAPGPYQRGVDPEYDWYEDRHKDGWDCERRRNGPPAFAGLRTAHGRRSGPRHHSPYRR
ncbi:excalibur calcium-binding domain-containing protein [Streptosporangium sp. NPDC051023]|uniref:excalibur calcium-binding domain-containing protein n=1 Tax=Streptosporangium sp. NPDC051023 TaxID=3155410 RepID=UPI00344B8E7D